MYKSYNYFLGQLKTILSLAIPVAIILLIMFINNDQSIKY